MQDFKYTLRNVTLFLSVILVLTMICPIFYIFFSTDYDSYDNDQRDALAGTVDTIASGASHIMYCFDPDVYDREMGTVSYNLGGSLITMRGRYALLKAELARNPVKTVILELSYNSLTRGKEDDVEGDMYLIPRLPEASQKLSYLLTEFPSDKYAAGYSFAFLRGLQQMVFSADSTLKRGMAGSESVDLHVSREEYPLLVNAAPLSTQIQEENTYYLDKILNLCAERDIRVILVTVPVSQRFIIQSQNIGQTHQQLMQVAQDYGYLFLDFNLHKDKTDMFPDSHAFTNETHMCSASGSEFTALLSQTIQDYDRGEDIFDDFYRSYEEIPPLY